MADVIHRWSEEKIPEYEQMMRVGIFSEEEVKSIIKKVTALEYKLVRKMKVKEDYLAYIQYNIYLLSLIKKRRKRINYFFKRDEIDFAIANRVHRVLKQCTFRWPDDIKLWSSHVNFCKAWNKKVQLSKIWTTMLQFHGNTNIDLWLMAAKWEYEDNHSVENARQIFLRGIRHYPDDPKLWKEYFLMELIHVMRTRQRLALLKDSDQQEDFDEDYLKGEAAKIIYKNAVDTLENNSSIKCEFLNMATRFAFFAGEVINLIIEDLFHHHEKDALARSNLAQLHLNPSIVKLSQSDSIIVRTADIWAAEKRCWEDFEVALEELASSEIWHEYLCFLISRASMCRSCDDDLTLDSSPLAANAKERCAKLTSIFERGHESKLLATRSYLEYIKYLISDKKHDKAIRILEECSKLMQCTSIKLKLLELVAANIDTIKKEVVTKIIVELCESVPAMTDDEMKAFWTSYSTYACMTKSSELLWQGLKDAKKHRSPHVSKFAVPILELECNRDVDIAFGVYKNRLLSACPTSQDLFDIMLAKLKNLSVFTSRSKVLDCFEISADYYGKWSPKFWLEYISFAMEFDRGRVTSLYWKAMKTLDSKNVVEFSENYAVLQTKQSKI